MISNNDNCNNDSVSAISEYGSVKRRLRNKTSGPTTAAASSEATGLAGNQHLNALVSQNVLPVQGRRRVSIGFDATRSSSHKNIQAHRPQTRGTTQQQQQLLLAQQLPQVSITLIKNPDADGGSEHEPEPKPQVRVQAQQSGARRQIPHAAAIKVNQKRPGSAAAPATSPQKKSQPLQTTPSNPTASQRNFMNNLPYMGELTFDSRPRRGRKPKKADICHLISKNYGIQFPKCMQNNVAAKALAPSNKPGSTSSPSVPLPLPLSLSRHPKKRKLPQCTPPPPPDLVANSVLQDFYASAAIRAPNLFSSRSPTTPSLITLQKLYQEKFSGFEFLNQGDRVLEETQPLNLCTRDADADVDVDVDVESGEENAEDEDELQEYNNNSIRNWLGAGAGMDGEDECYDNAKNKKPKAIITRKIKQCMEKDEEAMEDENQPGGNGDDGQEDGTEMLIGDDGFQYENEDTKPPKFSSFLVKNHFLCSNNDDEDEEYECRGENGNDQGVGDRVAETMTKKTRRRRHVAAKHPQQRSLSLINPSGAEPSKPGQNWTYHHHQLVPSQTPNPKSRPRGRDSKSRKRSRPEKKQSQPTPADNAAVSAAVAASNNAQVSICKFKFTGGVKPTLQEKKMLSLDSGGNFRFYTDKPLQSPASAVGSGGGSGMGGFSGSAAYQAQAATSSSGIKCKGSLKNSPKHKGKVETKVSNCGNVTTTTSLLSLPKSAKSMSMCMLPTGSSSSAPIVSVASTSTHSSNKPVLSPLILPDITISACNSNSNSSHPDPDNCSSIKSSCCNSSHSSCYSSSRASSPSRSCCSNSSEVEDGESASSSLLQVPSPLQQPSSSLLSSSAVRRPHPANSSNNSSSTSRRHSQHQHPHHSSNDVNSRRRTKKSMARENLEKTFKEKGFLIQTQQLESSEGVTYCKFRQLKKFTRYLFRSWKDYLPENVKDSIVISGSSNHHPPGRQITSMTPEIETGESVQNEVDEEVEVENDEEMCDDQDEEQEEDEIVV